MWVIVRSGLGIGIPILFGNYWHEPWDERERKEHYSGLGYECYVIWADSPDDVILEFDKIKEWINLR